MMTICIRCSFVGSYYSKFETGWTFDPTTPTISFFPYMIAEAGVFLRPCLHGVGDPGVVGFVSFVFTLWGTQNKRKPTPLDRGPPLHVNRVLELRKPLLIHFCVVMWVLFSIFSIFCITSVILPHGKFLQTDWLRAVIFQLNLKYLHVKITNRLRVVV